jgi:hypothetical protein
MSTTASVTVPPAAASVGMANPVFVEGFSSPGTYSPTKGTSAVAGVNWFPYFWAPATGVSFPASGGVQVTGGNVGSAPTYFGQAGTSTAMRGTFMHGYFEARMKFAPGTSTTAQGVWPAFWLMGVGCQAPINGTQVGEIDGFEAYPGNAPGTCQPIQTLHNWEYVWNGTTFVSDSDTGNTDGQNFMTGLVGSTEIPNPNDGNFHTYGILWKSTGPGTGYIEFYFDDMLVIHTGGVTRFAVGTGTKFPAIEANAMALVLQGGVTQPATFAFVHVFQAPPTQSLTFNPAALSMIQLPATTDQGATVTYSNPSRGTISGNVLYVPAGSGQVTVLASAPATASQPAFFSTETVTVP